MRWTEAAKRQAGEWHLAKTVRGVIGPQTRPHFRPDAGEIARIGVAEEVDVQAVRGI